MFYIYALCNFVHELSAKNIWKIVRNSFKLAIRDMYNVLRVFVCAVPRSAVGRAPDSYVRGTGFDTMFGHILSFLLPLIQAGQLSVTGERMCTG